MVQLQTAKKTTNKQKKTYNTMYSLVVTDPTTNPALRGLTLGEQTGPRILHELWSYVTDREAQQQYEGEY